MAESDEDPLQGARRKPWRAGNTESHVTGDYSSLVSPKPFQSQGTWTTPSNGAVPKKSYLNGQLQRSNSYTAGQNPPTFIQVDKDDKNKSDGDSQSLKTSRRKSDPAPNIQILSLKAEERRKTTQSDLGHVGENRKAKTPAVSDLVRQHENLVNNNYTLREDGLDEEENETLHNEDLQLYEVDALDTIEEDPLECLEQSDSSTKCLTGTYGACASVDLGSAEGNVADEKNDQQRFIFDDLDDQIELEPLVQTLFRQDSSENVVIEIKPKQRIESPTTPLLQERKRSKSVENLSPKDYLVVRANRKLALQNQERCDQSNSYLDNAQGSGICDATHQQPSLDFRTRYESEVLKYEYPHIGPTISDTDHFETPSAFTQLQSKPYNSGMGLEAADVLDTSHHSVMNQPEMNEHVENTSIHVVDSVVPNDSQNERPVALRSRTTSFGSDMNDAEVAEILRNASSEEETDVSKYGLIVVKDGDSRSVCSTDNQTSDDADFRDDYSDCAFSDAGDYISYKTFVLSCDIESLDELQNEDDDEDEARKSLQRVNNATSFQTKLEEVESMLKAMNKTVRIDDKENAKVDSLSHNLPDHFVENDKTIDKTQSEATQDASLIGKQSLQTDGCTKEVAERTSETTTVITNHTTPSPLPETVYSICKINKVENGKTVLIHTDEEQAKPQDNSPHEHFNAENSSVVENGETVRTSLSQPDEEICGQRAITPMRVVENRCDVCEENSPENNVQESYLDNCSDPNELSQIMEKPLLLSPCSISEDKPYNKTDLEIKPLKSVTNSNAKLELCRQDHGSQTLQQTTSGKCTNTGAYDVTKRSSLNRKRTPQAMIKHLSKAREGRKVKAQDKAKLVAKRKKLHDLIHGLNKKKRLPRADELKEFTYDGEMGDDMIWKLLKRLISAGGESLFEEEECREGENGEECSVRVGEDVSNDNHTKEDVRVVTYLSPDIGIKSKAEFTPLVSPSRKTLPFNVKELFLEEIHKAKERSKFRENLKELRLITGGNVVIKDNKKKDDERGEKAEKASSQSNDVITQSTRPFKMSSAHLILPKLALIGQPTSLHHELANQVSEEGNLKEIFNSDLNEKELSDSEEEMGQQEDDSGMTLAEMLLKAQEMLNNSRLDDAEAQLLRLYQRMQEKPEDNTKILIQTLTGLADICTRRSRMCRSNPMEWQWLCMHAISLLHYTVEICDSELEGLTENQDVEWYNEQKQSAEFKCRPLEDSFNRALYNCLKHEGRKFMDPFRSFSFPNTPTTSQRLGLFPLSTGSQFSVFPGMNYKYSATLHNDQKQTVDDTQIGLDWLTKFHQYCNDRLQSKNVGDIFHKIFRKRSRRDNLHPDNDETESVVSDSAGSLDWDHNDLQGIEELEFEPISEEPTTVQDQALAFEFAYGDVEDDGWDFFLNDRKGCKFQSVVQVASEKDAAEKPPHRQVQQVQQSHVKSEEKEIVSPLHEHSIKLTLAKSYSKLAEKLAAEEDYCKSEVLYEQVLKIVDEIQDGTAGMLRFNAQVLKNLGTVKSKLGKATEGLEYLNKALETYKDLQDDGANFEIAVSLLELGNGYVVGKSNEDGVFDDAIGAICEFFEKDLSDEQMTSSSSSGKSDATSTHRSPEEEENIEEAIHCYREALSLLQTCDNEKQMDAFAKATMRLGDCYFMQKDYDSALECFEKALSLFQRTSTLGRDLMIDHAHVMCMVGVSTFMLHMYPRAASTFELALHMVKYAFGLTSTFLHGLLLSMMGITFYKMKNYHRCVSVCYQGFEIFCNMHGDKLPTLPKRKFWLVCQILYVMGVSYNNLNLHLKAIKYLTVARTLMMACKMRERRQFMRVLQILGDCYFAQYDYKTALQFYNEALEYGDCESQVSFDEVFDPNTVGDNMTMHNQLVSKSAEAHISMQQYQNAVHYLEQAHDMQEDMGNDIKEDLINTLNQLGQMHSMAGDVDQAIDSFNESVEVYKEIHGDRLGSDMCKILGNLGTMFYVKACICDQIDEELDMVLKAEKYFQDAMAIQVDPSVSVKYANFLYSQGNYEDAIMYLDDALKIPDIHKEKDLVYGGLEKVTLPDCLQDEVDCQEEVVLSPTALARYLLVLSHKMLGQMHMAERHTLDLMCEVIHSEIPILYSVLGYSLMELSLFEEALECFDIAVDMESEYQLAKDNFNLCLCICTYQMLIKGVENICLFYKLPCYYTRP